MSRGRRIPLNVAAARILEALDARGKRESGRSYLFNLLKKDKINAYVDLSDAHGGNIKVKANIWQHMKFSTFSSEFNKIGENGRKRFTLDPDYTKDEFLERLKSENFDISPFIGRFYQDKYDVIIALYSDYESKSQDIFVWSEDVTAAIEEMPGEVVNDKLQLTANEVSKDGRGRRQSPREYVYAACASLMMADRFLDRDPPTLMAMAELICESLKGIVDDKLSIKPKTLESSMRRILNELRPIVDHVHDRATRGRNNFEEMD